MADFDVHVGDPISPPRNPFRGKSVSPDSPLDFTDHCDTNKDDFENSKEGYMAVLQEEQ
jgi:hypothetical protein